MCDAAGNGEQDGVSQGDATSKDEQSEKLSGGKDGRHEIAATEWVMRTREGIMLLIHEIKSRLSHVRIRHVLGQSQGGACG